jgi:hypothetical protein
MAYAFNRGLGGACPDPSVNGCGNTAPTGVTIAQMIANGGTQPGPNGQTLVQIGSLGPYNQGIYFWSDGSMTLSPIWSSPLTSAQLANMLALFNQENASLPGSMCQADGSCSAVTWSGNPDTVSPIAAAALYAPARPTAPANVANPQPVAIAPSSNAINSSGASQPAQSSSTGSWLSDLFGGAAVLAPSSSVSAGNWFTDSMLGGFPNWLLLAGIGLGVWALMGSSHGR